MSNTIFRMWIKSSCCFHIFCVYNYGVFALCMKLSFNQMLNTAAYLLSMWKKELADHIFSRFGASKQVVWRISFMREKKKSCILFSPQVFNDSRETSLWQRRNRIRRSLTCRWSENNDEESKELLKGQISYPSKRVRRINRYHLQMPTR